MTVQITVTNKVNNKTTQQLLSDTMSTKNLLLIDSWNKLVVKILENDHIDFIQIYKHNFIKIVKSINNPVNMFQEINFLYKMEIIPLYLATLYYNNDYKLVYDFVSKLDLNEKQHCYDFYIAKIIRYYYLSSMHLKIININEFYKLKVYHSEYNNEEILLVLNNIILEYFITNQPEHLPLIFNNYSIGLQKYLNNIELVFSYFYQGYGNLILGNYDKALDYFNEADIYNTNIIMKINIIKCIIVTKLLLGESDIVNYKYSNSLDPYYQLITIVKNGQINDLDTLLKKYKSEFLENTGLYFIIKRLMNNVLKEGIKKIATIYTKIKLDDINKILNRNITYLVYNCILNKEINSIIKNNILIKINSNTNSKQININNRIKKIINIREEIKKQTIYSEVPKLTYDRVIKEESDLNDQFGI